MVSARARKSWRFVIRCAASIQHCRQQEQFPPLFAGPGAVRHCSGAAVVPCVLLCYCISWLWPRELTLGANAALDGIVGVHLRIVDPLTVEWNGIVFQYGIACTF